MAHTPEWEWNYQEYYTKTYAMGWELMNNIYVDPYVSMHSARDTLQGMAQSAAVLDPSSASTNITTDRKKEFQGYKNMVTALTIFHHKCDRSLFDQWMGPNIDQGWWDKAKLEHTLTPRLFLETCLTVVLQVLLSWCPSLRVLIVEYRHLIKSDTFLTMSGTERMSFQARMDKLYIPWLSDCLNLYYIYRKSCGHAFDVITLIRAQSVFTGAPEGFKHNCQHAFKNKAAVGLELMMRAIAREPEATARSKYHINWPGLYKQFAEWKNWDYLKSFEDQIDFSHLPGISTFPLRDRTVRLSKS